MCIVDDDTASKPRPSGWLWVETQQHSDAGTSSSSERLAGGASSPAESSDDLQHDGRDHHRGPPKMPAGVRPAPASLPRSSSSGMGVQDSIMGVQFPVSAHQPAVPGGAVFETADRATPTAATRVPSKPQTSPRVSPLPPSHRVLTPPIAKTADMPFISDRTFPLPADSTERQPQPTATRVREVAGPSSPSASDVPGGPSSPKSPTSKPPPPPRTVSVKSPPAEVLRSSRSSDSYETMKSYSQSSAESSKISHHAERFSSTSSYEYSKFETSENYEKYHAERDLGPGDTAADVRVVPLQSASPREAPAGYGSGQQPERPITDPPGGAAENRSGAPDGVGQATAEPGAVDLLFSYHRMTEDAGKGGQFSSSSSFSSRCSPAVQPQPGTPPSSRPSVQATHYYV